MTAKQKAEELVDTYRNAIISFLSDNMKHQNAKTCAIITVNKILEALELAKISSFDGWGKEEWEEVKVELLKDHWSTTSGIYQKQ